MPQERLCNPSDSSQQKHPDSQETAPRKLVSGSRTLRLDVGAGVIAGFIGKTAKMWVVEPTRITPPGS